MTVRNTTANFITKAVKTHGGRYDYSNSIYTTVKNKVEIRCVEHNEVFWQVPASHLKGYCGCPICAEKAHATYIATTRRSLESLLQKLSDDPIKGKLTVTVPNYKNSKSRALVTCPKHGEFTVQLSTLISSIHGCRKCAGEAVGKKQSMCTTEFIELSRLKHGDTYDYSRTQYSQSDEKLTIICKIHGEFQQFSHNHLRGCGCPKCVHQISKAEQEVFDFVKSFCPDTERGVGLGLPHRTELDIIIPSLKLAIEFDGAYYHSEKFRKRNYHCNKTKLATGIGYKLIHISEYQWENEQDIVKARLLVQLGKPSTKTFGRKTKAREIPWEVAEGFLKSKHLQGAGIPGTLRFGLYAGYQLMAVIVIGKARFGNSGYELLRYASEGQVLGGLSKLIKACGLKGTLISYSDNAWGTGKAYEIVGFKHLGVTQPSYAWYKYPQKKSRYQMQKHKLRKILKTFDPNLSEAENCHNNGWWRVYDCGSTKWELQL